MNISNSHRRIVNKDAYLRPVLLIGLFLALTTMYFLVLYNEVYAIIFSLFILAFVTITFKWQADLRFVFTGVAIFTFFKIYNFFLFSPITGPDSSKYFQQTQYYNTLKDFFIMAINVMQERGVYGATSYTIFGIFYMPFYFLLNLSLPQSIALFNSLAIVAIIYIWHKITVHYFSNQLTAPQLKLFNGFLVIMLFISPVLTYWSSAFLKDVFGLFLGVISLFLFMKKRYVLTIIFVLIAIAIRPYALAFIFCFWLINTQRNKLALIGALSASAFVVYKAGVIGLVNTVPMMARILMTPNPFSLENWSSFFFPTVEGIIVILGTMFALINFLGNKESRRIYITFFFALVIYACTLTLVGHTILLSRDLDYGILSAGDDMFRKKLPFMLVTYTMIAYTVSTYKNRLRLK